MKAVTVTFCDTKAKVEKTIKAGRIAFYKGKYFMAKAAPKKKKAAAKHKKKK